MVQKLVVFLGLIMSATCMYLHEVPLYLPIQYQEPTPDYNFAYEVNDAHTGDYKRQQETRIGDTVLGAYSLLQPDGLTRTVVYRADDHSGFNAEVNNVGRQNEQAERQIIPAERQNIQAERQNIQAERREDRQQENGDAGRQTESRPQVQSQPRQAHHQQATEQPSTIAHTSLVHHVLRKWK